MSLACRIGFCLGLETKIGATGRKFPVPLSCRGDIRQNRERKSCHCAWALPWRTRRALRDGIGDVPEHSRAGGISISGPE